MKLCAFTDNKFWAEYYRNEQGKVFALEVPEMGSEREMFKQITSVHCKEKEKIQRRNINFSCGNVGWGIIFQVQEKAKV